MSNQSVSSAAVLLLCKALKGDRAAARAALLDGVAVAVMMAVSIDHNGNRDPLLTACRFWADQKGERAKAYSAALQHADNCCVAQWKKDKASAATHADAIHAELVASFDATDAASSDKGKAAAIKAKATRETKQAAADKAIADKAAADAEAAQKAIDAIRAESITLAQLLADIASGQTAALGIASQVADALTAYKVAALQAETAAVSAAVKGKGKGKGRKLQAA